MKHTFFVKCFLGSFLVSTSRKIYLSMIYQSHIIGYIAMKNKYKLHTQRYYNSKQSTNLIVTLTVELIFLCVFVKY